MAGGSVTKENATDQQCPECNLWWGARGSSEHIRNCDGERADRADDDDLFDPAAGAEVETPTQTMTNDDTPDECPECGGSDGIIKTKQAYQLFKDAGRLSPAVSDGLAKYDWYHNDADCMAVFDA